MTSASVFSLMLHFLTSSISVLLSICVTIYVYIGLPFSLQFFDGFEELPLLIGTSTCTLISIYHTVISALLLALGYARNPESTIPKAISVTFCTVSLLAIGITVAGKLTHICTYIDINHGINMFYYCYCMFICLCQ